MPVPNSFLDGEMPYGTTPVTIDGETYIVKSFTPDNPVAEVVDEDSNGSDSRARVVRKQRGFSAELQLATSSTAYPQFGDTFTYITDPNYGTENWVVHTATVPRSNGASDIRTVSLTGKSVINSITTVS
jgi:hypothetical protein